MYSKYHSIAYRKDIDGLRALAVLSTIAYHAFPNLVSSGFVGVDIFFVISGFLITKIILENLESNSFSFTEFYLRRIRRIFPALFLVLIVCYGFGWFALYASEFRGLGGHIAASAGFVQNFMLLNEINYFERSVDTKPLIHLWSLSIEEQFYLLWPAIIWILYKTRINLLAAILILVLTSFSVNIYSNESNPITAFYSPLSRFWELLVGALWACISLRNIQEVRQFSQAVLNKVSWVGLLLIAIAIFFSNKNSFPGWWALLPTVGAALLIFASSEASVNKLFLSNNAMVWLGVISYPLYLWHWILLSFGQIVSAGKLSDFHKIVLILVAIGLAYLTHRYWESLFRYKGKKVALLLIALMILIGYQGWSAYARDGLDFRHKDILDLHGGRLSHTDTACLQEFAEYQPTFCKLSYIDKNVGTILIGDSIAHNHFSGLEHYYTNIGQAFAMIGWPGTQPFLKKPESENYSLETGHKMNQLIIGLAHNKKVKTVILGFREMAANNLEKAQLERTIKFFKDSGKQVMIISPPPHLSFEPIECTGLPPFRPILNQECTQLVKDINAQFFIARIELNKIAENFSIKFFDTYQQICIDDECPLRIEGGLLYRNKAYLTVNGSKKIFEKFTE
jgi:peptidoglycan/LPS O-acetylase OafA/YrhL